MTGTGWLGRRAALSPRAEALRFGSRSLTWSELEARCDALSCALAEAGVREGDRVAALLPNAPRFVALFHAVVRLGAVFLPLHLRLTALELERTLRDAGAGWIVHDEGELGARARALAARVPSLRALAARTLEATRPAQPTLGGPPPPLLLPAPSSEGDAGGDPTLALLYTSGTTGEPKGVELGARSFFWSAFGSAAHLGALPDDRWLACLPLYHVGGLAILVRSVLFGSCVVLHERFDPERVARDLAHERIRLVSLVPTMLARVLEAWGERPPPPTLRCVLLGGGPIPPPLLERAWRRGWPVAPTYGLTEAGSQVATLPLDAIGRAGGPRARPLLVTEVRVADEEDRSLPAGRVGEILVRGPTLMKGYRGRPEATAQALRGGWLHTGDLGELDPEGFLRVHARRSDLVVTGGENVVPAEVEAVLLEHPQVREAAVAGEPDPELGQRVVAWVVPRPGARLDLEALQRFCRERLAGYKLPRRLELVGELPRTASGKLRRAALKSAKAR